MKRGKRFIGTRICALALSAATLFTAAFCMGGCSLFGNRIEEELQTLLTEGWKLSRVPDVEAASGAKVTGLADEEAEAAARKQVGEQMAASGYSTEGNTWINATVPATVLTSYEYAGLIEDPYFSDNMEKLDQDYYNVDYWYRTEFTVPEDYQSKRVWLNFDGINHKADIYLNGQEIGKIEGAFIRGKFDVTDVVNVGETNYLAVYIHWCDSQVEDMPSFLCSASWDWMPAIPGRNMGIYKDVYLSASGDVTLEDPFIQTDLPLPDVSSATASISVDVRNTTDKKKGVTIEGVIRPLGSTDAAEEIRFAQSASAEPTAVTNIVLDAVTIENPKLWWPNGYGEQNLYELELRLKMGSALSDIQTVTFGVREFTYDTENDYDLRLSVNGVQVMCKGGNWGCSDAMLKWTDEDFDTAVKLHKDMNFTMIRTWHGTSDFDAFYEACDKYGILIMEDFWLNGPTIPDDTDMFMNNVYDKVKRLRNHASLAIWVGENEATPPGVLSWKIPKALRETDPNRLYIPASNADPVSGGVTYAIQTPDWFFEQASGFTTEIGSVCVPTVESMRQMMREEELWPVGGDVWKWHDYDEDIGNKLPGKYTGDVNGRYGTATNIDEFCKKAQLINLETYKAMFEAWNDKLWDDCSGILLWMSSPAWPSTIWQTYDYYWAPTGAYFGCKEACEPVHIQWNPVTGEIKAINNTTVAITGATVEAEIYNLDGTMVYSDARSIDAGANAATASFNLYDAGGANLKNNNALSSVFFIKLRLKAQDGSVLSENFYWRSRSEFNYQAMNTMEQAALEASVTRAEEGEQTRLTVTLRNPSSVVAVAVQLMAVKDNAPEGEDSRILPVTYSENYVSLLPGEERTVEITFDTADCGGATPQVVLEGYNTARVTVSE